MRYIIVNTIEIKNGNPHSFVNPTASELDVLNKYFIPFQTQTTRNSN